MRCKIKYRLRKHIMRIYFLIATFFLSQALFLPPCTAANEKFIDAEGNITDPIVFFLELTGIYIKDDPLYEDPDHPKPILTINSRKVKEVVQAVQGKINHDVSWMMKGKRWEMYNSLLTPATAKEVLEIGLQDLGFKEPIYPQRKDYKGILLLGASAARFDERVLFANQLPQLGINFGKVYILTGPRPLEEFEKERFSFLKNINDEGEMTLTFFEKNMNEKLKENY